MNGINNCRSSLFMELEHYLLDLKRKDYKKYRTVLFIVKGSLKRAFNIYKQCAEKVLDIPVTNTKLLELWKRREDNWYRKYVMLDKLVGFHY